MITLLRYFDAGVLITRSRSGGLHGRPMAIAAIDDDATLWFITSVASAKVDELSEDARAMVTLQRSARFVCLNGHIELFFDRDKIKALWKESYRVWYDSDAEPEVVLLRFTPFDAEYWDSSGLQGLKYAFQAARAYVAGEKLNRHLERKTDPESHAKIKLWNPLETIADDED